MMRNGTVRRVLGLLSVISMLMMLGAIFPVAVRAADAAWRGEYYDNPWLTGAPVQVRTDPTIAFNWGTGSPASGLPVDNFSVRWTRTLSFQDGMYRFTATTDDGVRLYLDGQLVIDRWYDQATTAAHADRQMSAGDHVVRIEYYERTGAAVAGLNIDRIDGTTNPPEGWLGEYFANRSLSGSASLVRDDAKISFNWGDGSPDGRIPADGFSVRWTRDVPLSEGRYRFVTIADDGVRLFVDDKLVLDRWSDSSGHRDAVILNLTAGVHRVRLEYYENTGQARVTLTLQNADTRAVGNIITCVRPANSWIKIYRWDNNQWLDLSARGWGANDATGFLKIDGLPVDVGSYGSTGQPYRVELWANGSLIRSVGNTSVGQAAFRVRPNADNYTPWGCPAP